MIAAILVMLASLLGCSIAVEAHQINLTNARIVISPDRIVEVEIALKGSGADRVGVSRVLDDATDAAHDLLDAGRTETALTAAPTSSLVQVIGRYLGAGIAHIFLGYDHIAFLAAVVLWARRLWSVVKVVTAFTVAHSITLSLAALDIVRIPSAIIEPAIAASIVYVAAENLLSRDVEKRWRDAFRF